MFSNTSITMQLVRGVLALGAIVGAVILSNYVWAVLPLALIAIVLMRGCPMCWLSRLFEAFSKRRSARIANTHHASHTGR